jgi:putative transposase
MIYHVINWGNSRLDVFHNKVINYRALVDLLVEDKSKYSVSFVSFCFMASHVRRYHCHYRSSGHVWQGRYKSFMFDRTTSC